MTPAIRQNVAWPVCDGADEKVVKVRVRSGVGATRPSKCLNYMDFFGEKVAPHRGRKSNFLSGAFG